MSMIATHTPTARRFDQLRRATDAAYMRWEAASLAAERYRAVMRPYAAEAQAVTYPEVLLPADMQRALDEAADHYNVCVVTTEEFEARARRQGGRR
jgi:hypothetical protein